MLWNQNDDLDMLYVCEGPAFSIDNPVQIMRIPNVSREDYENLETFPLTDEEYNYAFPSTNAEGTKLVFRSSRNMVPGGERQHKNLYIIDAEKGEAAGVVPLTDGAWTDTHCSWSPGRAATGSSSPPPAGRRQTSSRARTQATSPCTW